MYLLYKSAIRQLLLFRCMVRVIVCFGVCFDLCFIFYHGRGVAGSAVAEYIPALHVR
jgi:Na+-driven multidrug efflux pump